MLKHDIEECKEIARLIAREEIAKALADFKKPVASVNVIDIPNTENGPLTEEAVEKAIRSHHKKP
jgi:hypothetical protein